MEEYRQWLEQQIEHCLNDKDLQREHWAFCKAYDKFTALRQPLVSGSLLSDTDYWKQRCLLAEKCLEESPCDPDITADQIKAWNAYHKFISWAGNDR